MANQFIREAIDGGDNSVWAAFEQAQNHSALSIITGLLYDDAGALKFSIGRIGLDNGSNKGTAFFDSVSTVSLVGLTASRWALVELSVVGTTPSLTIASIAGATDPAALPASFTGAYVGAKGGYYVTATKRVLGLAWINAGGALEGIVNCMAGQRYTGYATSDDADDYVYRFEGRKGIETYPDQSITWQLAKSAAFTAYARGQRSVYPTTTAAASFNVTVPLASTVTAGKRIRIPKVDTGAGIATVIRSGADTFGNGATAFPLRAQGDFIELESDGASNWLVVDSLATLQSAALATGKTNTAHGCGIKPRSWTQNFINLSTELNYAAGEIGRLGANYYDTGGAVWYAWGLSLDTTNFGIGINNRVYLADKTTGAMANITLNKWAALYIYSL